jgi:hypothetical protein
VSNKVFPKNKRENYKFIWKKTDKIVSGIYQELNNISKIHCFYALKEFLTCVERFKNILDWIFDIKICLRHKHCQIEVEKGLRIRENVGQFHVFLWSIQAVFHILRSNLFAGRLRVKKCSFFFGQENCMLNMFSVFLPTIFFILLFL